MSWTGRVGALVLAVVASGVAAQEADLVALFDSGVPFSAFLEGARARRREWRENYQAATVDPAMVGKARELPGRRRLLVVAEDWCSDSANTIPYLAKFVQAVSDRVELHVVKSDAGKALMDANKTPDGRAATPTVAVLDEGGHVLGVWVERPSALQTWYLEQQPKVTHDELTEGKMNWYRHDAGKSTVGEIVALMERTAAVPPGGLR